MSSDMEQIVLAGILPNLTARMEKARLRLVSEANFETPGLREIWRMIESYYDKHRAIIPELVLRDMCLQNGIEPTKVVMYVELYRRLSEHPTAEHEFDAAIELLKGDEMTRRTAEAIITAREILQGEYYDEGSGKSPAGHEAAREYLNSVIPTLDVQNSDAAPEGNMADDMDLIWETYLNKEANPESAGGIKYGIPEVDLFTGGAGNGELILIAGFTGHGKSHFLVSTAMNAMLAGKNILLFTTETVREEMEIRILARYSRLDKFRKPGGLDSHKIMNGGLDAAERDVFRTVLADFKANASGRIDVVQMPSDGSANYVKVKAAQYNRNAQVDIILIDSINLLRANQRFDSKREMLEELLQDFKRFASSFDNGRGVPIVSPWQMSRTAWEKASEAGGIYTKASLADTSEAEKCFTLDTPVLTPSGFVEIGKLSKGDEVIGSDGKSQRIREVHETGEHPIYEVLVSDSTVISCTPGHLWSYVSDSGNLVTATAEQLMEWGGEYILPELKQAPDLSKDPLSGNLPHPYLLGRMLASAEEVPGQITFTTRHPEWTVNTMFGGPDYAIRSRGEYEEITFTYREDGTMLEYPGMAVLVSAGLLTGDHSKFRVPPVYLNSKAAYREALLRGLVDNPTGVLGDQSAGILSRPAFTGGDGRLNGLPVKWLADSLGLFDEPRRIIGIRDTGTREQTRCITVANDDQLYVTDGFVLTHNSASQIITIFVDEKEGSDNHLYIQVLKNRGGREMSRHAYQYDYSTSYIGGGDVPGATSRKPTNSKTQLANSLNDLM